ncbi:MULTISPECIES: Holliday junction resolvase RuvX [Thermoanaerobacter]|uniref:Putative pre-16S rRNA nuclease n=1 Tax=Thermoanaerobacter italicus (strain DSM 9252 / Ab9) TaxID=580331 RepID=D3T8M8_THEIA|nr:MULTISPECIES: Holliday junction resolvase RuvX [Thermoanaerobacter]ADD02310.1 Holliday junction resolvase YqgF [Thermoanaerobacter italicus Ab9]
MRIMGLDVGDKTIGIAISDLSGTIAQGLTTIKRSSNKKDFERIKQIINEYEVGMIIVGLPKNMNGTLGPQGQKVVRFVEHLKKAFSIPIILWDERLTTVEAERVLIEKADISRAKRKEVIDKLAAVLILQNYLDSQKNK